MICIVYTALVYSVMTFTSYMSTLGKGDKSNDKMKVVAPAKPATSEPTITPEAYTRMVENYMDSSAEIDQYHKMANAIRFLSIDAIEKAKSGHPGLPMGMADVCTVLFKDFLKFNPEDPDWADRDRFILSAGHGSMLLYSLLYLNGYKGITLKDIKTFR